MSVLPNPGGAEPRGPNKRVLFADDEGHIRRLFELVLTRAGHSVELASSGDEALRLAITGRHDALIVDRFMPGLSGLEVIRRLRALPATVGLPIVLLMDKAVAEEIADAYGLGADLVLTKPLNPVELAAFLDHL